ncbi:MAG: ABC transporter ATP-binding protein [Planctomycetota bacterium]
MSAIDSANVDKPRLRYAAVSKWYGQVSALSEVSFEVGREVVGLVGRNGAGKSTLMKLATGLLRPSLGEVRIDGHLAATTEANAVLGFSPDLDKLYERCTGRQFVAWMLRLHGFSGRAAFARAGEVLDELGLGPHMGRRIREYSKGMRQRVRLAQALAHGPRVLLLDEPMTGLDPIARHELSEHVRRLGKSGLGVLVSSHVLHELEAIVDRVALVHQGRLIAEGAVSLLRDQLREQPHRIRIASSDARALAGRLTPYAHVIGLEIRADSLDVALNGEPGFYSTLTSIAAEPSGLVLGVRPLDDSLASVFGYLVG